MTDWQPDVAVVWNGPEPEGLLTTEWRREGNTVIWRLIPDPTAGYPPEGTITIADTFEAA